MSKLAKLPASGSEDSFVKGQWTTSNSTTGKNSRGLLLDWEDNEWRFSPSTDSLWIFFIKTTPGMIRETVPTSGLFVDLDENEAVVSLEIRDAGSVLPCRVPEKKEEEHPQVYKGGKPGMQMRGIYDPLCDEFQLFFIPLDEPNELSQVQVEGIDCLHQFVDARDRIYGFSVSKASTNLRKRERQEL